MAVKGGSTQCDQWRSVFFSFFAWLFATHVQTSMLSCRKHPTQCQLVQTTRGCQAHVGATKPHAADASRPTVHHSARRPLSTATVTSGVQLLPHNVWCCSDEFAVFSAARMRCVMTVAQQCEL